MQKNGDAVGSWYHAQCSSRHRRLGFDVCEISEWGQPQRAGAASYWLPFPWVPTKGVDWPWNRPAGRGNEGAPLFQCCWFYLHATVHLQVAKPRVPREGGGISLLFLIAWVKRIRTTEAHRKYRDNLECSRGGGMLKRTSCTWESV